ncbi:MAG TPA: hypothetical protein VH092_10045 [Urbifossiella sp.]|nr:hypothetical protein [Urbifossiella sp.]
MIGQRRFARLAVVAGLAGLAFPAPGRPDDAVPPPRPGQVRGVLAALKTDGGDWARQGTGWILQREYPVQLLHMATDPRGMAGGGWYRPSQSRYGWEWLAKGRDRDGDGAVSLAEFGGPREWFEALDRDRDGALTKDDFDWAAGTPLAAASARAKALFGQIDRDGNGQATADEWALWFDGVARGKGYVGQDDLMPLFLEKKAARPAAPAKAPPSQTRLAVACSYISGDVGSPSEGPAVGDPAPDLPRLVPGGKDRPPPGAAPGPKPLVLIFGSFT